MNALAPRTDQGHIVIAEDDVDMRRLIARMLAAHDFRVTEVGDGAELLAYLTSPSRGHVDLVVSDVHMPKLSGLEVLDICRLQGHFVPTLLLTAFSDDYTRAAADRFGAIAVLDKPLELDDLRTAVVLLTRTPFGR